MSDDTQNKRGGVRRVGEKDRKNRLDTSGSLFPPESLPPSLPEDVTEPETPDAAASARPDEVEIEAIPLLLDDDAAALLAEIETDLEAVESVETADSDDKFASETPPDEDAQYRRPAVPVPYDAPQDRFPPLPGELAPPARVKPASHSQPAPAPRKGGGWVFNCLTLIFTLGTCALAGVFVYLWQNPYSAYNPFPPFTPPPIVVTQTLTPTLTYTPTDTPPPTATSTPPPTETPTPAATDTPEAASTELAEAAGSSFALLNGQTIYITNPDGRGGCRWSSIAGTVSALDGGSLNGYQVRVLGNGISETAVSGTASGYGPGGFEIQLGNDAVDAEYAVQLLDPDNVPVSDVLTVSTSSRCDWNISVLRFVQNPA